jgi:hypothetical protein
MLPSKVETSSAINSANMNKRARVLVNSALPEPSTVLADIPLPRTFSRRFEQRE